MAPIGQCLPVPAGFSDVEAASLPETCFTVWQNVFEIARLQPGEALLVQGGTSGIGVTAIQLAKALGARVLATAGSDAKCAACLSLGADGAINYRTQDFVAEARRLTDGRGVDVVLDMVAGDYVAARARVPGRRRPPRDHRGAGRHAQHDRRGPRAAQAALDHRLHAASALGGLQGGPCAGAAREGVAAARAGPIRPVIHQTYPAAEAAAAHALMESGTHIGKIVLTWHA